MNHCLCQRVGGHGFKRSSNRKQPIFVHIAHRHHCRQLWLAFGQCAGFVKRHGTNRPDGLQRGTAFNQQTNSGRTSQGRRDRRRGGDHQGTGAADQKQGQPAIDPFFPALPEQDRRNDNRQGGKRHDDWRIDTSKFGNETLDRCLVLFALFNQLDHTIQHGLPRRTDHLQADGPIGDNGAGKNLVPRFGRDGNGFTGQVAVVNFGCPVDQDTVGRNTFAWTDFDNIIQCKRGRGDRFKHITRCRNPPCGFRGQFHQRFNPAACPPRSNTFKAFADGKQQDDHTGFKTFTDCNRAKNRDTHQQFDGKECAACRQTERRSHHRQCRDDRGNGHGISIGDRNQPANQPAQHKPDRRPCNFVPGFRPRGQLAQQGFVIGIGILRRGIIRRSRIGRTTGTASAASGFG